MILNWYYKIWVDGIIKLRSIPSNRGIWKFYSMIFISLAMAFNLGIVISLVERNILRHSFFNINLFENQKANAFFSFFVVFMLTPLLVNYLLIFRKKRYELLITKYRSYNGKLCASYIVISYLLPFILLLVAFLLGY